VLRVRFRRGRIIKKIDRRVISGLELDYRFRGAILNSLGLQPVAMIYYINPNNTDPKTGMISLSWVMVSFDKFYGYFDSETNEAVILDIVASVNNNSARKDREYILEELGKFIVKRDDQTPPHITLKFL